MRLPLVLLSGLAALVAAAPLADDISEKAPLVERQVGDLVARDRDDGKYDYGDRHHRGGHGRKHDDDDDHRGHGRHKGGHGRDRDRDGKHDRDRDRDRDRKDDRDRDRDRDHDRDRKHDRDRDRGYGRGKHDHDKRDVADDVSEDVVKRLVVANSGDGDGTEGFAQVAEPVQLDVEDDEFAPQWHGDRKHGSGWHYRRCDRCPRRFGWRCDRWKRWCRRRHRDGIWYWGDSDDY